jgi:hypothetical protein
MLLVLEHEGNDGSRLIGIEDDLEKRLAKIASATPEERQHKIKMQREADALSSRVRVCRGFWECYFLSYVGQIMLACILISPFLSHSLRHAPHHANAVPTFRSHIKFWLGAPFWMCSFDPH